MSELRHLKICEGKEKFVDATKLREKYGITMNHELAPGIRRTVAWYAANYEAVKDRHKFARP